MATVAQKKAIKKPLRSGKQTTGSPFSYYWNNMNFVIFGVGVVLAIIGFYLSSVKPWNSDASLVYSPIILVVTYVLIFPLSILFSKKKHAAESEHKEGE